MSELTMIEEFKKIIIKSEYYNLKFTGYFGEDKENKDEDIADIEFLSSENEYLIIEAKTHLKSDDSQQSTDKYNTVHKIFGQLLKENGKTKNNKEKSRRNKYKQKIVYAVLINADKEGEDFYRNNFKKIPFELYFGFGKLVTAKYIFSISVLKKEINIYTWEGFYNKEEPIKKIEEALKNGKNN